ncbi:MAG: hypothetical protein ACUVWA_08505 [Candidatus Oleimicrobiaceae bacterium]
MSYTIEYRYWVGLAVMPLARGRLSCAIIDLAADPQRSPIPQADLYGILQSEYWDLSRGLTSEEVLRENYLSALWKQGLTAETPDGYVVGPQWELIRPYRESLQRARNAALPLAQIADEEAWISTRNAGWAKILLLPTPCKTDTAGYGDTPWENCNTGTCPNTTSAHTF